jgi:hypothetical protein
MKPTRRVVLAQLSATALAACAPTEGTGKGVGTGGTGESGDGGTGDGGTGDGGTGGTGGGTGGTGGETDDWTAVCEDGSTALPEDCARPTPLAGEGPFLRDDVPERTELNVTGDAGEVLIVTGRVLGPDCQPRAGLTFILWSAGGEERFYDTQSEDANLYGWQTTDDNGAFCFRTLKPVPYGEEDNLLPAHLHIAVNDGEQRVLTTQLAFDGDPYLENDPKPPELIVTPEVLADGSQLVRYDFILPASLPGGGGEGGGGEGGGGEGGGGEGGGGEGGGM